MPAGPLSSPDVRRRRLTAAVLPLLVCLLLNGLVLAGIAVRHPAYLDDAELGPSPDARHYVQLGRNLLLRGHYSRMDGPPYQPDLLRTPVFPVLAGALDLAWGALGIYGLQVGLHLALTLLVCAVALRWIGERAALWAGLLVAADLMLAVYNFNALTEPLYLTLTFGAIALLLPSVLRGPGVPGRDEGGGAGPRRGRLLACGLLFALATLTRPVGLYLPLAAAALLLLAAARRRRWRGGLHAAALVLLPSVVLAGGWMMRNQKTFGVPRLSTVDAVGMIYMAGAGAYQLHHGIDRPEAQRRIAEEHGLPTLLEIQNPWLADGELAEMDGRMRRAVGPVLSKYPADLLLSSVLGLLKGSLSHDVDLLATLHDRSWTPPGLGSLARLEGAAFGRLLRNPPSLVAAFVWQVGHAVAVPLLALVGLWRLLRRPSTRPAALVLLLFAAYFYAGMALFGVDAYYRARIPVLPFAALFAGAALAGAIPGRRSLSSRA